MLKIERAWKMYEGTMPKPRQIFATQSSFLAEKVREYFGKLSESMNVADKVPQEIKAMFSANRRQQTRGLVDLDEELVWRDDAHKCFSELRDEDFPLFVTFDQVCQEYHISRLN
ncbi:hypothetical protein WOLCODRAFT_61420 [Wolfiporia cocos MD-104 SS10]|uniref:Uncharacterized protein n=1 Tax=Wolfiporia cocos (strain MD-104) TaxID=742152 RepID=A0A2H3IST8_WOLCO|nr:hypothetical protein WOLCODRAFT_61420 [Wolfiporia cocos MD-104 SS10]